MGYSGKALATACAPNRFVLPDNPTKISLPEKIKMRMKIWSQINVSVHLEIENKIFWDRKFLFSKLKIKLKFIGYILTQM